LAILILLIAAGNARAQADRMDDSTELSYNIFMANSEVQNGNLVGAINHYYSALQVLQDIEARHQGNDSIQPHIHDTRGIVTHSIARVFYNRGHYARAKVTLEKALESYRKCHNDDAIFGVLQDLAACERMIGDLPKAAQYYEDIKQECLSRGMSTQYKSTCQLLTDIYVDMYMADTDPDSRRQMIDKAAATAGELYYYCSANDKPQQLNAYNNVAYCRILSGDYASAIKDYESLIRHAKDDNNLGDLAVSYTNLGICYQKMGQMKDCYAYLQKAAKARMEDGDIANCSRVDNILAMVYLREKDLYNAEVFAKEAIAQAESAADPLLMEDAYDTYSEILKQLGNYDGAMQYREKCIILRDSLNMEEDIRKKNENAELRQLIDAEQKSSETIYQQRIERKNMELLKSQHDKEEADRKAEQERHRAAMLERDQALKTNELQRLQIERMMREREVAIDRAYADSMRRQADIQQQKLINEKQKQLLKEQERRAELELRDSKSKSRQLVMMIAIVIFALLLVVFLVFFVMMRRKNREILSQKEALELKNEELDQQRTMIEDFAHEVMVKNDEIQHKNKSITDSILYAKRIQESVCVIPEFLDGSILDYFVFFRPKDIVSGDFFWFHNTDRYIFAVAADCTGHGVPGAFMSMLGISLLNKIVAEHGEYRPNVILNEMRDEVKRTLHQKDMASVQKDGMDMSLVRIDVDTLEMQYAGANNDGYLLKRYSKGEAEQACSDMGKRDLIGESPNGVLRLVMMNADSMPVGVYIDESREFTVKSYQLRHGDTIYLISDGILDQFGGPTRTKFKKSSFKKLIMDINSQPISGQKQMIEKTIDDWIGTEHSQMDDMVVLALNVR